MTRSAVIAAAYMLALSQGGPMRGGQPHYVPTAFNRDSLIRKTPSAKGE